MSTRAGKGMRMEGKEKDELIKAFTEFMESDEEFSEFVFWCLGYGIRRLEGREEPLDEGILTLYQNVRTKLGDFSILN